MMAWLPSPTWFTVIGGLLCAGAVGCLFLPLLKGMALDLGLVGGVFLLLAACAHTYTARGEATVQAKFDAFKTAQAKLAADIASQQATALAKAQADADQRVATEKARGDALQAKVAALQHRNVTLSAALSNVLQQSGANTAAGDTGVKPGGQNATVAVPDATEPQAYDEAELGAFFAATRAAYDSALNAWQACVADYTAIRAPTLRGASP